MSGTPDTSLYMSSSLRSLLVSSLLVSTHRPVSTCRPWHPHLNLLSNLLFEKHLTEERYSAYLYPLSQAVKFYTLLYSAADLKWRSNNFSTFMFECPGDQQGANRQNTTHEQAFNDMSGGNIFTVTIYIIMLDDVITLITNITVSCKLGN